MGQKRKLYFKVVGFYHKPYGDDEFFERGFELSTALTDEEAEKSFTKQFRELYNLKSAPVDDFKIFIISKEEWFSQFTLNH
jgi:hypothetical protein